MIWKKGLTNITGSEFIKNIMMLITGNIIGYGINLITLPIISRIYTQSELGEYELILSSAGIFLAILQLSMMLVIMIPEEEHEAVIISKIILYFTLFGSILIVAVLLALAPDIQFFHVNISYSGGILLFGLYLIFYNLQNIYYSFTNRKKLYSILLWNPVLMAAANGFFFYCILSLWWRKRWIFIRNYYFLHCCNITYEKTCAALCGFCSYL